MKKAKLVNTNKKQEVPMDKDNYSLKNLLLIVLVLVVIFGIFYFITTLVIDPIENNNFDNGIIEIDATKITLNNILNRKEKEYYVLATKKSENNKVNYIQIYNSSIQEYTKKDNSLKFYYVNLDDALNKNYLSTEINITNEISELKVNDDILFKIKNNKIDEYFVGSSDILNALSKIKES